MRIKKLLQVIETAPLALPTGIAAFGLVSMCLLLIGQLKNILVWPVGLIAATLVYSYIHKESGKLKPKGDLKERNLVNVLAICFILLWTIFGIIYTSQNIFVRRDPAIYTNTAAWLTKHESLVIPTSTEVFGEAPEGASYHGSGFSFNKNTEPTSIYAQGTHMFPALLGLGGRIVGVQTMFKLTPLLGALGLLAMYGAARMLLTPRWALLSIITLGISLPFIYFTRDAYSEPLTLSFVGAFVGLFYLAGKNRKLPIWLITGLMAGSTIMVRVDGYLIVAATIILATIYVLTTRVKDQGKALKEVLVMLGGMLITGLLGWLDTAHLATGYYSTLREKILLQIGVIIALCVFGAIAIAVSRKRSLVEMYSNNRKVINKGFTVMIIGVFLVLASRPLWHVAHHEYNLPPVGAMQTAIGEEVDVYRSYGEETINWIIWYIGPLLVVLAVFGLILVLQKEFHKKETVIQFLPLTILFSVTAALYLIQPNITPDHVWAMRRFLPVVLPGFVIFGYYGLSYLANWQRVAERYRIVGSTAIIQLTLIFVVVISTPFLTVRTYVPQFEQIDTYCNKLGEDEAVVFVGNFAKQAIQPTRSFCNKPVIGVVEPKKELLSELAISANRAHRKTVLLAWGDERLLYGDEKDYVAISAISENAIGGRLHHPPRSYGTRPSVLFMADLELDGSISRIEE